MGMIKLAPCIADYNGTQQQECKYLFIRNYLSFPDMNSTQ